MTRTPLSKRARAWVGTMRRAARRPALALVNALPAPAQYWLRTLSEGRRFAMEEDVHALPQIFHYWSNTYLLPKQQQFGFDNPEQFFAQQAKRACVRDPNHHAHIVSIGSGNCDMEARLAARLREEGIRNFRIDCLDVNPTMLQRGREHARRLAVSDLLQPLQADFNRWRPSKNYDLVIANQSLHHVVELERLFDEIRAALTDDGLFAVSDMIGRNGHQRWPEALAAMQPFWQELPADYRYNRVLRRQEHDYLDHDCSQSSFEGIRAQDVLRLLTERFEFDLFIPFANIVIPFIDRSFGHNFDATQSWDRDFIDRVHARDEHGIVSGELKPTQMLAAMGKQVKQTRLVDTRLTPTACIRHP